MAASKRLSALEADATLPPPSCNSGPTTDRVDSHGYWSCQMEQATLNDVQDRYDIDDYRNSAPGGGSKLPAKLQLPECRACAGAGRHNRKQPSGRARFTKRHATWATHRH